MVEEHDLPIPWSTISKRMGKRSRLSCFKKWQKMTGIGGHQGDEASVNHSNTEYASPGTNNKRVGLKPEDGQSDYKRQKTGDDVDVDDVDGRKLYAGAPTAGAAAAMAAGHHQHHHPQPPQQQGDYDVYSAKIAAETVEAVELPDTEGLVRMV